MRIFIERSLLIQTPSLSVDLTLKVYVPGGNEVYVALCFAPMMSKDIMIKIMIVMKDFYV